MDDNAKNKRLSDMTVNELEDVVNKIIDKPLKHEVTYGNVRNTMWNSITAALAQVAVMGAFLGVLFVPAFYQQLRNEGENKGKVARLHINGTIGRSNGYGNTDANKIVGYFDNATASGVSAYWIIINSGGGYVYPSKEIADKVLEVRAGKDGTLGTLDDIPVVMQIKDIGASGAYMIAATGERIFADETSLVGSIGVRMDYLEYSELARNLGIKPVSISKGKYKTIGNPFKEMTEEEKKVLDQHIETAYRMFITHVAKNRTMKEEDVEKVATGWVYYGSEAKEHHLIDEIGDARAVEEYLKRKIGKNGIYFQDYKEIPSFFESLAVRFGESVGKSLAQTLKNENEREYVLK